MDKGVGRLPTMWLPRKTERLTVAALGQQVQTFADLPVSAAVWNALARLGFSGPPDAKTTFSLHDIHLQAK